MQTGHGLNQTRCSKCQAPLGRLIGRCPFCGAEIGSTPDPTMPFQPAYVGMTDQHRERKNMRGAPQKKAKATRATRATRAAVFASAALLLIAVGGTAAFFLARKPNDKSPKQLAASVAPPPERPPLNIHGVVLKDGPEVDPTDVVHLVRGRLLEMNPGTEVALLGVDVHRARRGKVDLDDPEASITYRFLVIRRDSRASKAKEKTAQRFEFMLRSDAPALQKSEAKADTPTVQEPLCVWSAAWRTAIASGLSEKDHIEASYGLDDKGRKSVWTFSVRDRPETHRAIDGKTCAIKASLPKPK